MELITELGKSNTGYLDKKTGKEQRTLFGLFKCTCGAELKLKMSRGIKQISCNNCKGLIHGMSSTKVYGVWRGMVQRCTNPNNAKYPIYGGKGITICDDWLTFEGFWKDNESRYADGLTIDRKDSAQGYTLENTRWISLSQNSSETTKRRPVIQLTLDLNNPGEWIPGKEWESAKQAADSLKLVPAHITAVCSGNRKTHGGFAWKYAD